MDYSPPGSSVHGISQARILEKVAMPSSMESCQPGIEPMFLALQVDSLPAEKSQKPQSDYIFEQRASGHRPLIIKGKWVYLLCSLLKSQNKILRFLFLLILHWKSDLKQMTHITLKTVSVGVDRYKHCQGKNPHPVFLCVCSVMGRAVN